MLDIFGSLQWLIELAFAIAAPVLSVFGLVDALRHRPDAFTAAGKASKNIWLAVLGVAVALSFLCIYPVVMAAALRRLGIDAEVLDELAHAPVLGHGQQVGSIHAVGF